MPLDEAVAKIRACAEARTDPDFVINARTDALAVAGIDEVIRRGNAYLEAGATLVFIDGMTSKALTEQAVRDIRGPVSINLVEGGRSLKDFSFADMQALGVARVSLPLTLILGALHGMRQALAAVRQHGGISGNEAVVAPSDDFKRLAGFDEVFALEKKDLSGLAAGST